MAVTNDKEISRSRASATRTGPKVSGAARMPRRPRVRQTGGNTSVRGAGSSPSMPSVTHLRARPLAVELEQLPLAVGFGSTIDLSPCRLWVVPGLPGDLVTLPALLDDGWSGDGWPNDKWPDDGWSSSTGRAVDVEPTRVARAGRSPVNSGFEQSPARRRTVSPEPAPLHLTARGRAVLLLLAAVVGVVVVVFAWFGAGSSATAVPAAQLTRVTVHDGDTLWSIAGEVAPNRDPRAVVAQLLQLNHLRSPALVPGQVLLTR